MFCADGKGLFNNPTLLILLVVGIVVIFAAVFLYFFVFRSKIKAKIQASKENKVVKEKKTADESVVAANIFNKRQEDAIEKRQKEADLKSETTRSYINSQNFSDNPTSSAGYIPANTGFIGNMKQPDRSDAPKQTAKDIKEDEKVAEAFNYSTRYVSNTMTKAEPKKTAKKPADKAKSTSKKPTSTTKKSK